MQASDWRPIESAPKDGTPILMLDPVDAWPVVGYWTDDTRYYEAGGRWVDVRRGYYIYQPTHWMPLPPQPAQEDNQ